MTAAPLALAERYVDIDQPERALAALDRLDGSALEDPEPWRLRAAALALLERHEESADAARRGLELDPDDVGLLALLGLARSRLGDPAGAEEALLAALRLQSDRPDLLCQYAMVVARDGQLDKAQHLVDRAAAGDPEAPEVLRTRTGLAYLRGDRRGTREHSRELLAYDPLDAGGHAMLGLDAYERGDKGRALGHFETAARQDLEDEDMVGAAREMRLATHPLMLPLFPFERFGPMGSWLGAMALILGTRAAGLGTVSALITIVWVLLCVYSWVAPPLLRRALARRR